MIRKVKFSNFYSFYKKQEINFLAKKKETYDYYDSKSEDQISKIAGFIGGNASGKTNVMRFFSFLSYFVCRKIDDNSPAIPDIACKTFFNNNESSKFYIEFENNKIIFFYNFTIRNNKITKESLSIKKIKKGSREIKIFLRESNLVKELNKDYFKNISINALPDIREDVSLIAFIKKSQYNVDIVNDVYSYFMEFKTNINELGQINNHGHQFKALNIYLADPEIKKEVEDFICNFDIGLSSFDIKKEIKNNLPTISIQGVHRASNKKIINKLDFIYESRGTQSLFFAMANILSAIKNNNVVIIDEIESGFHHEALNKLINFFINENKKKNAQLIFSSHSLGFMNKLDMHQIFLVDKNNNGESHVNRLNKIKGIRSDENFLSKYMSGSYGAFPKIRV